MERLLAFEEVGSEKISVRRVSGNCRSFLGLIRKQKCGNGFDPANPKFIFCPDHGPCFLDLELGEIHRKLNALNCN